GEDRPLAERRQVAVLDGLPQRVLVQLPPAEQGQERLAVEPVGRRGAAEPEPGPEVFDGSRPPRAGAWCASSTTSRPKRSLGCSPSFPARDCTVATRTSG